MITPTRTPHEPSKPTRQTNERIAADAREVELKSRIHAILNRHPAADLAVGVVRNGRLERFHGHGHADIASNTPITEDTVVGEADPQNPPAKIADASTELANSVKVVVPGEAHTVGHLGCLPSLIADLYKAGTAQGLDTTCVASMRPPPFDIP